MIRFLQSEGRLQKALQVILLTIVCVMMVVYLIPGGVLNDITGRGELGPGVVARVDGREITMQEVDQLARGMMQQRHIPEQFKSYILPQAVDAAVLQKVYLREAEQLGLRATDDDLRYEMQHGSLSQVLYPNGSFIGSDQYRDLVASQFNLSVPQFERELRNELTLRKLRSVLGAGISVSDAEVHNEFLKERTRVKFEYAVLTAADLQKSVTVDDAELRAYYEKNKQEFANSIPEQRQVKYVVIDPARLPHPAKPLGDELDAYYRQHAAEFRTPEAVKVSHILIKLPPAGPDGKVDAKKAEAAYAKAKDVLKQLRSGADFAAMAKKYSDDKASAANGGSVGEISKGSGSAPEIEKVAFGMSKGQISDVIPTSYGYEIIRVDDTIPAHNKSLEEVKSQIEPMVVAAKNLTLAGQLAQKVTEEAKASGLDKAAADNGLQAQQSGFISRTDSLPGIGNSPQFASAAFDMKQNATPVSVQLASGYAVAQVTAIKPAATPSFEQVKDRITTELKQQKAQAMLMQKTQEISDKARASHNLQEAAKAVGATVKTSDLLAPDGQTPELGQLSTSVPEIFEMKPGEVSKAINLGNKGVVIDLLEKDLPTDSEYQLVKSQIADKLLDRKRADAEEVFVLAERRRMEKEGKIQVDKKKIAALTESRD